MAGSQRSALAVAVSNAGGLGSLPCALLSLEQMREELTAIRAQTTRPFRSHGGLATQCAGCRRVECRRPGLATLRLAQPGADEGGTDGHPSANHAALPISWRARNAVRWLSPCRMPAAWARYPAPCSAWSR